MSPSCQKCLIIHSLFPLKALNITTFNNLCKINGVDVIEWSIFSIAACDNIEFFANNAWSMESTSTWSDSIIGKCNLFPYLGLKVKNPEIIQVSNSFASKSNQIWIDKFSRVICSFPWCNLAFFKSNTIPLFRTPIHNIYLIKPCFILATSPKKN